MFLLFQFLWDPSFILKCYGEWVGGLQDLSVSQSPFCFGFGFGAWA